ncbi:MAG: GNAT family N-acetyltransferase [Actinomycetaceae bacterium]|nr:GNAT family N-acetyltransferase [Actinomycetaceae bacterium]
MTGLAQRLNVPEAVPYPGAHLGLRWRPLIAADAPAVFALYLHAESTDQSIGRTSAAEVADLVEGPRGHDLMDAIVGLDSQRRIVAVGSVRVLRDVTEYATAVIRAVIHPTWRGRGVGRSLLHWQDGRARQLLVQAFGPESTVPVTIGNFVDSHMTDRRRLYIAAGFSAKRTFQVMYRELEGSEVAPKVPEGIRLVRPDEIPLADLKAIHQETFLDHFRPWMSHRWFAEGIAEMDSRWSWVALDEKDAVAGYILVGRPNAVWVSTGKTEAYISLFGVPRSHRGRKIASLLMNAAIASAAHSGVSRIGLDVDTQSQSNAHAIYERFGFVDDKAYVLYAINA